MQFAHIVKNQEIKVCLSYKNAKLADKKSMDLFDRRILDALQKDATLSVAELAERVGLSHTPCWRRLRKLEKDGVILGRKALLNAKALGLGVTVFAEVRLKVHDEETLEAFEASVRNCDEIMDCFTVSGERDYQLRVLVKNVAEYEELLKKVLLHLPHVASINSIFVLKSVKQTTHIPIMSL